MIKLHILEEMTHYLDQKLPTVLINLIDNYIFSFTGSFKNKFELNSINSICVVTDQLIVTGSCYNKNDQEKQGLNILCLNDQPLNETILPSSIIGSEEIYFVKLLSCDKKQIIAVPYYSDDNICIWDLETKSKNHLK